MLAPARVTQLMAEIAFVLLGVLVAFLGASGRIYFDRRGAAWMVLSAALVAWGLFALARPGQWWAAAQKWIRGGSLVLLGLLMLSMTRAPFLWVPKLLMAAGAVLVARGLLGSLLILKPR